MPPQVRTTRRVTASLCTLAFCLTALPLPAAPPAAPSNVRLYTTRDPAFSRSLWHLAWQNNALDQDGYIIEFRAFFRGRAISSFSKVDPNVGFVTSGADYAIMQFNNLDSDFGLQFRIVVFKNNGPRIETRAVVSPIVRFLSGDSFNKPKDFEVTKVPGSDGQYDLKWIDESTTEIENLLSYRKTGDTAWAEAQLSLFGENEVRRFISLRPATSYQFRLRHSRFHSPQTTDFSNIVQLTTEPLVSPSNLGITVLNDTTIRLDWNDNSDNTMGYELQYRTDPSDDFEPLLNSQGGVLYLGGNETSYTLNVPRGFSSEWRVRGVYQDTDQSLHYSGFSNTASAQTFFPAPSNVIATATGLSGSIAVKWTYNAPNATQFQVLGRAAGSQDAFAILASIPASTNETLISGLTEDEELEIGVRAIGSGGDTSAITEAVPVTPKHGFSPAHYVANLDPANFGTVLLTPLRTFLKYTGDEPAGPDQDGDGVPDAHDSHPTDPDLWCDWNNNGVNDDEDTFLVDSDLDGVADQFDSHPDDPARWCDWNNNNINDNEEPPDPTIDADLDGVPDDHDSHPHDPLLWTDWNNNGINDHEEPPVVDSDGDGIRNDKDSHPDNASLWTDWNNNGINDHDEDFSSQPVTVAHELKVGTLFESRLSVTDETSVDSYALTHLPPGFAPFDDQTAEITGTPTAEGIFTSLASVAYQDGHTANAKIIFRIQQPPAPPVIAQALPDRTIGNNLHFTFSLAPFFADPDTPRAVKLATSKGDIILSLNETTTPQAAANFLAYVRGGDYNGVAFHRSVPGFVIQGGGFKPVSAPRSFTSTTPRPSPRNEPGIANLRGTIAAAKLGSDPNSATHDFFINLGDNRENLDLQNRGFTVFGRVISGMSVADAIAALPRSTYSILLDGANATFQDWPMDAASAPAQMDITKTVTITSATEVAPFIFSIEDINDDTIIDATINGPDLTLAALAAGQSDITIRATDFDGNHIEQTFTVFVVDGHVHPAITAHPQPQTVNPGSQAVFNVSAAGSSLTYTWRKNGVPLPVQPNGPSLLLNDVTDADEGEYDVIISNSTTTLASQPAALIVTQPAAITSNLLPRIITTGQPLTLTVAVQGKPAPQVTWFKNNQQLTQSGPVLVIPSVTLTDHGLYRAAVTNSTGSVNSETVPIVVVDGTPARRIVKQGGSTSITVNVAAPPGISLTYQWRNGQGNNLTQGGRFDGVTRPRLNLLGINLLEGSDTYTCAVSGPGAMGSTISGPFDVIVSTLPEVTSVTELPIAFVGLNYEHFVAVNPARPQTPASFTINGLPRGLTYDRSTGRIHGSPLVGGVFPVRITARNPAGASSTVTASLRVVPMPASSTGQFVGLIERHADINDLCGGRLDVDLTDNAAFSARVTLSTGRHRLRGKVVRSIQTVNNNPVTVFTGSAVLKRRGRPDVTLTFNVNASTSSLSGELRLDNTNAAAITGWKNIWHRIFRPASDFLPAGAHHFAMEIPDAALGNLGIAQGCGYARLVFGASGIGLVSGRTIDNKPFSVSAPLGPAGSFIVFQRLYGNRGSIMGPLGISMQDANLFGNVTHSEIRNVTGFPLDQYKSPQQPAGTRDYRDGFTPPVNLTVRGGNFSPPAPTVGTINAIARLQSNGSLDSAFGSPLQANHNIRAMHLQGAKILIGGQFTSYNGKNVSALARLNADGTLDETFNPGGSGANGPVLVIALDSDGKILIGGSFTQFNGVTRNRIARLNADGTLDDTFNPGTGPNDAVRCIGIQSSGAIVIGGAFGAVGSTNRSGIARLTTTGTLDTAFNPGSGANNIVRCLAMLPDDRLYIGGDFTSYNGSTRNRLARLNASGTLDTGFNPSGGANAQIISMALQSDGRLLIGGSFTQYNAQSRNRIARILTTAPDTPGALDNSFNPDTGADGEVRSVIVRPDGKILIGGFFTKYQSTSENCNGVTLINADGSRDTSFTSVYSKDSRNNVRAMLSLPSNQILIGGWVWSRITSNRILGLNDSKDKALVNFSQAKIDQSSIDPDAVFTLSNSNRATPFGPNPAFTTLAYNPRTGILSGRALLREGGLSRTIQYTALLVPLTPSDYRGVGVFNLAELPDGLITTSRNSPIHTGRIDVAPAP